jgi:hypothetical protein
VQAAGAARAGGKSSTCRRRKCSVRKGGPLHFPMRRVEERPRHSGQKQPRGRGRQLWPRAPGRRARVLRAHASASPAEWPSEK